MKKPKMKLGSGGVKGLFIQHVEKIVFGAAVLLVFVFVVLGYRLDSKLDGKTPDKLQTLASTAVRNIEKPTFQDVKKERTPRDGRGGQYFTRLVDVDRPPDPTIYTPDKPWNPPMGTPGSKREDPEVFPPIKLETAALTGALCVRAEEGEENPLDELEYAPASEERKKRPEKKKRAKRGGYGSGGSFNPYGDAGSSPYGDSGQQYGSGNPYSGEGDKRDRGDKDKKKDRALSMPQRTYPADKVCGYRPSGVASGMSGGGSMPGSGGSMPGLGAPGVGGAGGMGMPGPGGGMLGNPGSGPPGAGPAGRTLRGQPIAKSCNVIVVKALAPYRKQADEFKRILGEAIGYDPFRDQPRIVFFQAQRADVTDDPKKELTEDDWKIVMHPNAARKMAEDQRWHGFMQEVADMAYVDPNATMPGPPIMLRCMEDVMLHSEVPRSTTMPTVQTNADGEKDGKKDDTNPDDTPGSDLPGALPGGGAAGTGPAGSGYPGSPGGYPGAGGSRPGYGSGMGSYPGSGMSGYPGSGMGSYPGSGMSGYPGSGMGGYPGSGMGGYPGSMSASAEPAQYKLIRFFDMSVEPGKVYRYRIRLFVEDPNNPNTDVANGIVSVPPRRRTLSTKVIDRLNKQQSDEKSKSAFYVMTGWSDPTEPVSLPSPSRVYVSEVDPPRMATGVGGALIQQSEMRGSVAPVVWHSDLAIDVPAEARAYRGSVLDFKKQFDILDPISLAIRLLKDFDFKSQFLVVDMRGGEDLPGDRKSLVVSAGEYALIDDLGNFIVRNELDDYEDYRRFTFEDENTSASRSMPGYGGFGSGGSMPGLGPLGGAGGAGAGRPGMGPPGAGGSGTGMPGVGPPGAGGGPDAGNRRGGGNRGRR